MSEGPIKRAREAWLPERIPPMPKAGNVVRVPEGEHPEGFPLWVVTMIPPHAAPSDIATLSPVGLDCPVDEIRRRAGSLEIVNGR